MLESVRLRARVVGASLIVVLVSAPATAQPTAIERESARTLMAEGRARRADGDVRGALQSFLAADAIMHVPTTGLEVARAQADLGQLVDARDTAHRVTRLESRGSEPRPFVEARNAAAALEAQLEPRVPVLRVELPGATRPTAVQLDAVSIAPAALAAPLRVDPGHHVLVAEAEGWRGRVEVDIAEGETKSLALEMKPVASAPIAAPPPPAPPPPESRGLGPVAWVAFGGAAVGVAVGTAAGIVSMGATRDARERCVNDACPPESHADLARARTTASVSTLAFVGAGAATVVGIAAILLRANTKTAGAPVVSAWFGGSAAGFRGTF